MMLALRMGRTLSELRQHMSANELMMWAEYDRISPIGDVRGDYQAAQIVSALYGSQGVDVSIQDATLRWHPVVDGEQTDPLASLEASFKQAAK
ncbi:DUF4035 domain-containing protein [Limnobaculum zhutongyuii]|uniref:DUF4035 domain-containing protein n=2 Tax=Limnobaculum zhutongyuii TaxID=2498113 RepID=A0A411WLY8_9GAMM|nr:DUF4035 domain-containing protein [Limnobaculum zhutongyuii]TQS88415.1 DUF4035 domain-containing protein [Limnobaculum zhutongyuii]